MAYRLGLREGDVITSVNLDRVSTINDFKDKLSKSKGRVSALRIQRGDTTLYLTLPSR